MKNIHKQSKIDPSLAKDSIAKAFIEGWNKLMDDVEKDPTCRIGIGIIKDENLFKINKGKKQ